MAEKTVRSPRSVRDPELAAMAKIDALLAPLADAARQRVLRWVENKYPNVWTPPGNGNVLAERPAMFPGPKAEALFEGK